MSINYRWLVQAAAFIGCIYFFLQMWEMSKSILSGALEVSWLGFFAAFLLFILCFFVMAVTSYLKQKVNGTLQNSIPFFDRVLTRLGVASGEETEERTGH